MVRIYTKTGDRGTTSLFGGKRVDKNSLRIRAYGEVDELNSLIGVILSEKPQDEIVKKLLRIQGELFVLGADLATPKEVKIKIPRVTKNFVTRLEREIDVWSKALPQLKKFILPGGPRVGAKLHLARTVARRVERSIVDLSSQEQINNNAQIYINRLSDWLFTLARYVNKMEKVTEIPWKGRGR
ncbi:MAG: cob(I)yrinic acid a,c-diamide adenosyltransferase [Patescibacteria group bacterium]